MLTHIGTRLFLLMKSGATVTIIVGPDVRVQRREDGSPALSWGNYGMSEPELLFVREQDIDAISATPLYLREDDVADQARLHQQKTPVYRMDGDGPRPHSLPELEPPGPPDATAAIREAEQHLRESLG